ncbi:MAG: hypothetical protein QXU20_02175 [Candidatus Woesearchaeota archaeon]
MISKNKKTIFYVLILLAVILLFSKNSSAVTSYSWITSGEDLKVNNKVFTIYVSTEKNLLVKYNSKITTILNNTCENIEEINICLLNVTITNGKPKAYIRTYYNTSVLTVSRTLSSTNVYVGQKILVNVTINNTANYSIPFKYYDELPEGLLLANGSKEFYAEGIIPPNYHTDYSYEIIALRESTYKTRAKIEYQAYGNKETSYSSLHTLTVKPSLNVSFYLNKTEIFIGEETRVDVNITNFINESKVEIKIIVPDSCEITGSNILCYKSNVCVLNSSIPKNSTKSFFINIKGKRFGSSQIILIAKNAFEEVQSTKKLIIKSIEPSIFFSNSLVFESDEEVNIRAQIQNPSTKISLKELNITVSSELLGTENISIKELKPMQRITILNKTITTPKENSRKQYKLKIQTSYYTEYGDHFTQNITKDIFIEPIKEITITHTFKNKIESYEETFFEVSVKNNRNANITITLEDKCPEEILKSNQTIKKTVLVYPGETVTAYTYPIKAPNLNKSKEYLIQTTATYNYSDEIRMISKTSKLEVIPRSIKLSYVQVFPSAEYAGNFFGYELQLTNSFREPIYNIRVLMPEQEEYDFKETAFLIKKLNPEEQVIVKNKLRPKLNGTLKFEPVKIFFEDIYGNVFEQNTTQVKIYVNRSFVSGEAIIANKSAVLNDSKVIVSLTLKNIGSKRAEVNVKDLKEFFVSIEPQTERILTYELNLTKEYQELGYLVLKRAILYYKILEENYTTYSNSYLLNLSIENKSSVLEVKKETTKIQLTNTTINQTKIEKEEKNFLREVFNSILKIFYAKRGK